MHIDANNLELNFINSTWQAFLQISQQLGTNRSCTSFNITELIIQRLTPSRKPSNLTHKKYKPTSSWWWSYGRDIYSHTYPSMHIQANLDRTKLTLSNSTSQVISLQVSQQLDWHELVQTTTARKSTPAASWWEKKKTLWQLSSAGR